MVPLLEEHYFQLYLPSSVIMMAKISYLTGKGVVLWLKPVREMRLAGAKTT